LIKFVAKDLEKNISFLAAKVAFIHDGGIGRRIIESLIGADKPIM
jgi:hypothetical protein